MASLIPDLTATFLLNYLRSLTPAKNILVAYSGGLDSHVLLHLFSQMSEPSLKTRAVYINHGLQEVADEWVSHCQKTCNDLAIPFQTINLGLKIRKGDSVEEIARNERYKALHESLKEDEVLVTAHHQHDQAETFLLQLFRGAGVQGLASMPVIRGFGPKDSLRQHLRPLLKQSRQSLEDYASLHKLDYIEDPSNDDQAFDRNYIRNHIMPQLRQRWVGIDRTISRSAAIQAETQQILDQVADIELALIVSNDSNSDTSVICIPKLLKYTIAKQHLFVRYWIFKNGFTYPSDKKLKHIFSDVVHASDDSQPLLEWRGAQIRRYQDKLYLHSPLSEHDTTIVIPWNGDKFLEIPALGITINFDFLAKKTPAVTVRFRQGGERIAIPERGSISLKNLFQEAGIPPWMRSRLPLIYVGDKLVKVIGLE